jgi:hypothetical protein
VENPRERGELENLWSGKEKFVDKIVENPVNRPGFFHSLWRRNSTSLNRTFHKEKLPHRRNLCKQQKNFSTGVFHRVLKRLWKDRIFRWKSCGSVKSDSCCGCS